MDRLLAVPLAELEPEQCATALHRQSPTVVAPPPVDAEPAVRPYRSPNGQASRTSKALAGSLVGSAFRALLATAFGIVPRLTHDVVVSGLEHFSGHRPTIIICNHKRDLDTVVLMSVMFFARRDIRRGGPFSIGLADKFFQPGFLGRYWRWPLLGQVMGRVDLRPVLRLLNAYPIGPVTSRARLPMVYGQLRQFVDLVESGHDVYWSPEGTLSANGSLSPLRAGLYRIVRESRLSPHLLPIHINYDFMTNGRPRCFVRIGRELPVNTRLRRTEFNRLAREAIVGQMTVNAAHLLAAVLRRQGLEAPFSRSQLETTLRQQLREYHRQGWHIDPRLTTSWTFHRRVTQLLAYASKREILVETPHGWTLGRGFDDPELRYVLNEISEIDPVLAPALERRQNMPVVPRPLRPDDSPPTTPPAC